MILECMAKTWSPGIGDPGFLGWATTVSYVIAVVLTFLVLRQAGKLYREGDKARIFWLGLTLLMVFLGLNKQLDLQAFLKSAVKCQAIVEGWYGQRREVQLIFVIAIASAFALLLAFILFFFRKNLRKDKLAVIGVVFLLVFILIHASYFNYFDVPGINRFYESGLNWVLELIGIFLICLQSLMRLKQR